MTHEEQRVWLINELKKDDTQFKKYPIPNDEQGQKNLLRALMNVWVPKEIPDKFIKIQDEYLKEESRREGITDIDNLDPIEQDSRIYLWQGDMTTLKVGAIVNPANSALLGCFRPLHNCADNIIHSKAGISLRYRCNCIMQEQGHEEPTGQAKITPAYNLPCEYVIHTVGPIVQGRLTKENERLLASCYRSILELADQNDIKTLALCCISTGVFMFPNKRAAEIAVETVTGYFRETGSRIRVVFNVFKDDDMRIYQDLLGLSCFFFWRMRETGIVTGSHIQ